MSNESDISSDLDFDRLISEVQLLCTGDDMIPYGHAIEEKLREAKIKYEYHDQLAARPYGEGQQILHELAEKYHMSHSRIWNIVYRYKN